MEKVWGCRRPRFKIPNWGGDNKGSVRSTVFSVTFLQLELKDFCWQTGAILLKRHHRTFPIKPLTSAAVCSSRLPVGFATVNRKPIGRAEHKKESFWPLTVVIPPALSTRSLQHARVVTGLLNGWQEHHLCCFTTSKSSSVILHTS